jgi:hypothetical protein
MLYILSDILGVSERHPLFGLLRSILGGSHGTFTSEPQSHGSGVTEIDASSPSEADVKEERPHNSSRGTRATNIKKSRDGLPEKLVLGVNSDISSIDLDGVKNRKLQKGLNLHLHSPTNGKNGGFI